MLLCYVPDSYAMRCCMMKLFAALFPLFFLFFWWLVLCGTQQGSFFGLVALRPSVQPVEGTIVCEFIRRAFAQGAFQTMSLAAHSSSSAWPVLLLVPAPTLTLLHGPAPTLALLLARARHPLLISCTCLLLRVSHT